MKRMNWIDICKALGVLTILISHANIDCFFFCLFYVSIFFFISGYLFKERSTKEFLLKQIKRLYIPYVLANLLILFSHNIFVKIGIMNNMLSFKELLLSIFKTITFQIPDLLGAPSWFIFALFSVNIVFFIIFKLTKKMNKHQEIFLWILYIILFILGLKYKNILTTIQYGNCSIFGVILLSLLIYYCGYISKKKDIFNHIFNKKWISFIIFIISTIFLFIVYKYANFMLEYRTGNTSNIYLMILSTFFGIYWIIYFSINVIENWYCCNKVLSYIGKNSLYIVLLQGYAFQIITFIEIKFFHIQLSDFGWKNVVLDHNIYRFGSLVCGILVPLTISLIIEIIKKRYNQVYNSNNLKL